MTDFQTLTYARGFLLSTASAEALEKTLLGAPELKSIAHWTRSFFGPCRLWYDDRLRYATHRDNTHGVGLLGLCVNPFDGSYDNASIAAALHRALAAGRDRFFDYVDQLSGAFVIIYRINNRVHVLQDTAATKPVYYHLSNTGVATATSHVRVLARLHDLPVDPRAVAVWADASYKADPSRYLPGLITPFVGASPLTANSELELSGCRLQRFFPREALAPRVLDDELVDETAQIMRSQALLLGKLERPLRLAATGGRDSRVSAVTFSEVPGVRYFTFHVPRTGHLSSDVRIATQLARIQGLPLDVYDLDDYADSGFDKAFRERSPMGIWPRAALCYLEEFQSEDIHIRSTVSEIGRCFYRRRSADMVSPEVLARTYTGTAFAEHDIVRSAMDEYIARTDFREQRFCNYDLHDMFYWEHRNSKWQSVLCSEAEMATDVFIPFNNRNLLKRFLALPYEQRVRAELHTAICQRLRPEMASVELAS